MNSGLTVLFRVDGSHSIGMGHVMRCLSLSHFFIEAGWKTVFACLPDLANREVLAGQTVEYVADADAVADAARKHDADAMVIDLSHRFNAASVKDFGRHVWTMRGSGAFTAIIDGTRDECITAKLDLAADMVVLPYVGSADKPLGQSTKVLAGPQYAIFGRDYVQMGKIKRELPEQLRNILVTMGGSDPYGLTETALDALGELDLQELELTVVVGPGFSDAAKAKLQHRSEKPGSVVRLLESPPGLAPELLRTDLAIINDGLTKYEAAVTGTPSIVLSFDEHQRSLSKDFSELGCYAPFGPEKIGDSKELAKLIDSVMRDESLRRRMSEIGTREFDPRGGARVVQEIEKELRYGK
jgi:UDP-2,4-diacetamido-2,4,6-trideoxy-beta-L-altropyranose hydrolase